MQRYLLGIAVVFAVLAFAYGRTNCEDQRDANQNGPMTWDIRCDDEGNYEELQCTTEKKEDKKWCACYNKTDSITSPNKETRNCRCPVARNEAQNSNPPSDCPPQCKNNNKYEFEERQCCRRNDEEDCYCVDEQTGERKDDQSCLHHSR